MQRHSTWSRAKLPQTYATDLFRMISGGIGGIGFWNSISIFLLNNISKGYSVHILNLFKYSIYNI